MIKKKDFGLLCTFKYPPSQIICNSLTSFIVCGGGTSTYKSGIPNKIELYDLFNTNSDDNTDLPILEKRAFYDTNKIATSIGIHFNYLLTAEKKDLCEYILIDKEVDANNDEHGPDNNKEIRLHRTVVNVFKKDENDTEITMVKYCGQTGSLLIAGGSTGGVKIYQRYNEENPMNLVLLKEIADVSDGQHSEVVDLDVSPDGEEFVSVCDHPDGKYARVWNISRGVKVTELALTNPRGKKLPIKCEYKFNQCRYGATYFSADGRPSFLLYATHHPTKKNVKSPSFMSVWGPADPGMGSDYQLIDAVALGNNKAPLLNSSVALVPSSLAVSGNGLMAAIGSSEGQVDVYRFEPEKSSLVLIYRLPGAHSFVVTDMTFMPTSRALATGHEFELLSVSYDCNLRYHRQKSRVRYGRLEGLWSLVCVLALLVLCDRLLVLLGLW